MLMHYVVVGLGGAIGAVLRVLLSRVMPPFIWGAIPFPILMVNILGCFMMGLLSELLCVYFPHPLLRLFVLSGVLGGFTTFSAFTLDIGALVEKNFYGAAVCYILLSVCLSIGSFFMGMKIIRLLQ